LPTTVLDANQHRRLEAVLWILNTGAQWHMLPQSELQKTVHRCFQTWCSNKDLRRVLTDVANELHDKGALDEEECFIEATFVMAKGGGASDAMPCARHNAKDVRYSLSNTARKLSSKGSRAADLTAAR
jgi:hypothetical protein